MSVDLSKYLVPQKQKYNRIYADISSHKYDSGWVEFIFPRMESQCDSPRSYGTGLKDEKEKQSFWKNSFLRSNYIEMLRLLAEYTHNEYHSILTERARQKIKQSIELFYDMADDEDREVMCQILEK